MTRILRSIVFTEAGLVVQYDVRSLPAGLDIRPVHNQSVLVHRPTPVSPGPSAPIAYGVTKASAFRSESMKLGARKAQAAAEPAEKRKLADFANKGASEPKDSPNERV